MAWPPASETKSVGRRREQESSYIILPSLNCIVNLLDRKWGFGGEGKEGGCTARLEWGLGYHYPQSLVHERPCP